MTARATTDTIAATRATDFQTAEGDRVAAGEVGVGQQQEEAEQQQYHHRVEHALEDDGREGRRGAQAFLARQQPGPQHLAGPGRQHRARGKPDERHPEVRSPRLTWPIGESRYCHRTARNR